MEYKTQFQNRSESLLYWYKYISENGLDRLGKRPSKAVFDVNFTILDPFDQTGFPEQRPFNEKYFMHELEYYLSGERKMTEEISKYKLWQAIADSNNKTWNNYYWHCIKAKQIDLAIEQLYLNPHTRRAVITVFDPKYERYCRDYPCTQSVQWYIIGDELNCSVSMRSNDLWFGFIYDSYWWPWITKIRILPELKNIKFGKLIWKVTDFHIYNEQLNKF